MSEDIAERHGVRVHRAAVGEANVVDQMIAWSAAFGGEGNGGPIDPKVGYVRDSFVGMALILNAMALRSMPVSALAAELPRYAIQKDKVTLLSREDQTGSRRWPSISPMPPSAGWMASAAIGPASG